MLHKLDKADDYAELESRGYDIELEEEQLRLFVVKKNGSFYAYRNICPHAGAPLNWQQDKFLNFDQSYIVCSLHGATFRIEDGQCIAGPCVNAFLEKQPIEIVDGQLFINL